MSGSIGVVILAAGKGTRMKTETPKALARVLGRPLIDYVVESSLAFVQELKLKAEIGVVVGHRRELLEEWLADHPDRTLLKSAHQREQNGTADALRACFDELPHFWNYDYTAVVNADTPLLSKHEFSTLFKILQNEPELDGVAASFVATDPTGYGRIVEGGKGFRIVEHKDATSQELQISEVNSGFYIVRTKLLERVLNGITNQNKSGEFYLTDMFQQAYSVRAIRFNSEKPFLGINTLEQLASVGEILLTEKRRQLMLAGVNLLMPGTVYVEHGVSAEAGATIYPHVTLLGQTKIAASVVIESGCFIKDSTLRARAHILANSHLEDALIGEEASVGPMARIRPASDIGPGAKIGNFVEVKKAKLKAGVKVSHLSYVGDAEIGENTNVGCGFITCNYDGANKHVTTIGKDCFIGSDCQAVAPITIGDGAFVAAGTTITKEVPAGAFAIGRAQFTVKADAAKRFLKVKKTS